MKFSLVIDKNKGDFYIGNSTFKDTSLSINKLDEDERLLLLEIIVEEKKTLEERA